MKRSLLLTALATVLIVSTSCASGPHTPQGRVKVSPSSNYLLSVALALCEGRISPEGEAVIDDWIAQNMPKEVK